MALTRPKKRRPSARKRRSSPGNWSSSRLSPWYSGYGPLRPSGGRGAITRWPQLEPGTGQGRHGMVVSAYAPNDTTLAQLEAEARTAKHGLWADAHPVPPWQWRKGRDSLHVPQSLSPQQCPPLSGAIVGNQKSKVYHWPGCRITTRCLGRTAWRSPAERLPSRPDIGGRK